MYFRYKSKALTSCRSSSSSGAQMALTVSKRKASEGSMHEEVGFSFQDRLSLLPPGKRFVNQFACHGTGPNLLEPKICFMCFQDGLVAPRTQTWTGSDLDGRHPTSLLNYFFE